MTSELEKEFFEGFGIEPYYLSLGLNRDLRNYTVKKFRTAEYAYAYGATLPKQFYPPITALIMLELICIESKINKAHNEYSDVQNLAEHILTGLLMNKSKCYKEVRAVFGLESEEK